VHLLWIWLAADVAIVAYLTFANSAKHDPKRIHADPARETMRNRRGKTADILMIDKRQTRKFTD
jgi:uncharacterized protein YcfJ